MTISRPDTWHICTGPDNTLAMKVVLAGGFQALSFLATVIFPRVKPPEKAGIFRHAVLENMWASDQSFNLRHACGSRPSPCTRQGQATSCPQMSEVCRVAPDRLVFCQQGGQSIDMLFCD